MSWVCGFGWEMRRANDEWSQKVGGRCRLDDIAPAQWRKRDGAGWLESCGLRLRRKVVDALGGRTILRPCTHDSRTMRD